MNDPQNPYEPYEGDYGADQYQVVGYDEYGRPVYQQQYQQQTQQQTQQQAQQQGGLQGAPGTEGAQGPQGYGYDPYAQQQNQYAPQQPPQSYAPYGTGSTYDPYGQQQTGTQARVDEQQPWIPQQPPRHPSESYQGTPAPQQPQVAGEQPASQGRQGQGPGQQQPPRREYEGQPPQGTPTRSPQDSEGGGDKGAAGPDYRTEQFSFIEEPDEQSEDVIDWLKFTESRTERREEAKRRGRSRVVVLIVVAALVIGGGVGYLWYAGKLPGTSGANGGSGAASGPQRRDVILVHLHNTKKGGTSSVLLVNNATTKRGTTVLLPNSLALSDDDGNPTTLGKSVDDDGSTGTGDSVDSLLGIKDEGTWRLDTPYLDNLVELVGNIEVDTDTDVPAAKKGQEPVVHKGGSQTLSGGMAVAYATYRASGEPESAQLKRFGQVMLGVLRKVSTDPKAATVTVQSLAQILDPSLPEKDLGSFLARLAEHAKGGDIPHELPVREDGTLSEEATDNVVKNVLGGTVKNPGKDDSVRVGVKNGTGDKAVSQKARVSLVNGGYTYLDTGSDSSTQAVSEVTYAATNDRQKAIEVAKTLGLSASAVHKGKVTSNADISVALGADYSGGGGAGSGG
ncbi:LytR family transcriptional regulator [Streptomyces tsukubensis]|uniref:LCP family protein n=1 Tax=Streptomyces tsukubensis TaxID=83656 RepID=UPI001265F8EC|nr:LCP family protein [Streptomyces tsukubensis]QFR93536.1 LytR family transcriptional regulator [Streptomyces tsukubensis]